MTSHRRSLIAGLALVVTAAGAVLLAGTPAGAADGHGPSGGQANNSAVDPDRLYDRFIVHFADSAGAARDDSAARGEIESVERSSGHGLDFTRRISTGGVLLSVNEQLDSERAKQLMARFAERPTVSFVEPDSIMLPTLSLNDTHYGAQWHYHEALAGMNLPGAWDTADGAGVTVAVVDTGITSHADLNANILPGYDFITSATAARDGNGRDSNPADEGDWTTSFNECYIGSQPANSSWHGTHVAGTVAAVSNNAQGVAGVAFNAKVVPARVLGKCGGTLADIADAIVWSAGGTVTGVPANANPAKVINMSLGGGGACGATYQNAINTAVGLGSTVVVAAGNANANAANYQPASCTSTVVVAASDREGNRASYSNYGTIVDVSAPGGETATATNGVASTLNNGTTTPTTEAYVYYQGTSMAAPHVAGLAALILGEASKTPAELEAHLKANVRALPGTCSGGCGAGLVDAAKAITALTGSPAPSPSPTPSASASPTAPPAPEPSYFENTADYTVPDGGTADSPITVAGRAGNAPTNLQVAVNVVHPQRGDLQIDLVAPDGTLYRLKSASRKDSADNVVATYTVNASTEVANGVWKLRVTDRYTNNTGYTNSWSLQF